MNTLNTLNTEIQPGYRQQGIVLLASLLFLLLLTSVAIVGTNKMTLSPRMLANAELKMMTFNEAQGGLGQVSALGDRQFTDNNCTGNNITKNSAYNPVPYPISEDADEYSDADATAHKCEPDADTATVSLVAQDKPGPRIENASDAGSFIYDYYQTRSVKTMASISSVLIQDQYKMMLGDFSNSGSTLGGSAN